MSTVLTNLCVYEILNTQKSNQLVGVRIPASNPQNPPAYPSMYNNVVIHEIDHILKFEELDIK